MFFIFRKGDIVLFRLSENKKGLSLRISLIISNKTGVCARVSGFITPRVKGADYSLICLHFIIIARYRQIFLISRT